MTLQLTDPAASPQKPLEEEHHMGIKSLKCIYGKLAKLAWTNTLDQIRTH